MARNKGGIMYRKIEGNEGLCVVGVVVVGYWVLGVVGPGTAGI